MKQHYSIFIFLFLFVSQTGRAQNVPLEFVENKGQWAHPFLYKATTGLGEVFLENDGFKYLLGQPTNQELIDAFHHNQIKTPPVLKYHVYKMTFAGANQAATTGSKAQQHYYNYFLGNDRSRWRSEIHPYLAVDYKELYPGIDLHVASEKGNLKYDFIVQPGSDPDQIQLRFEGPEGLLLKDRNLVIRTSVGEVMEMQPYAYQYVNGQRKEVPCSYRLRNNEVSYSFPKGYNKQSPLIIDPTVVFCTFTGSTADNWGFTATYDAAGNFYAGGLVSGNGYPVSTGAFQQTYAGGSTSTGSFFPCDMGIMKLDPTGANKIWATYIGGANNDQPHSMIVDGGNNLVIAGRTYSNNFPVTATGYDTSHNGGADITLTKLNALGTALVGSTYLGGTGDDGVNFDADEVVFGGLKHNYGDDARSEVLIDNLLNVYITACTHSFDFPTTGTAAKNTLTPGDPQDAIVAKLNGNLSSLIFGTYLGGSSDDAGYVIALDNTFGNLFVAGGTASADFPGSAGTVWPTYQGGVADGFICKFLNSGSYTMVKSTFIGRNDYDQVYGIQVDESNNVYIMGQSLGGSFPVSAGVYSNPNSSQFLMKTDANLSANLLSTVWGSGNSTQTNISPVAFLVDTCHNIYISGWGGGLGFSPPTVGNTFNLPLSSGPNPPAQATTDGNDFYFIVLSPGMASLLYATYYGRNSTDPGKGEHVDGGTSRFDKNGVVYQAICGGCAGTPTVPTTPFPTTPGSWSPNNGNPSNCNEVALKIAFQFSHLAANASTNQDTTGCGPLTIKFQNNSVNGVTYQWFFDDGTPMDTTFAPTHTFVNAGTYIVKLVAFNPGACNKTLDTDIVTITVDSTYISTDFDFNVLNSCNPYLVSFTNKSTYSSTPGSQNFTQFIWTFGDGSSFNGTTPPNHNYPDTGTYTVRLVMIDTTSCNSPDTIQKVVTLTNSYVEASFIGDSVCIGNDILFSNGSVFAQTFYWNFGDGDTSNATSPQHSYSAPGTYTVMLIAAHPGTCNKRDTVVHTVQVWGQPTAYFIHDPVIPIPNEPIRFTNQSTGATSYFWGFGDGRSSTVEHPVHLYKRTGSYKVCLEARNEYGCVHQYCKVVDAEIHPAIGVPSGFSPNGDGSNDILFVKGAAVETMNFKVYNRWGEKVFESNDMEVGWDGTFKGKPQEMEAYAWVLNATFTDGNSVNLTGNVTLLR